MSWFNFGKKSSSLFSSYGTINNFITGQFIGEYLFEKKIVPHPSYKKIKEVISNRFAERTKKQFKPLSRKIAYRILKKHVTRDRLSIIWKGLATKLKKVPDYHLLDEIKYRLGVTDFCEIPSPDSSLQNPKDKTPPPSPKTLRLRICKLKNYLKNNCNNGNWEELKALLEEWHIEDFLHFTTYLSLRPLCEPAILEAVGSASKLGVNLSIDFASQKATVAASLPVLSWLFSKAASWTYYLLEEQIKESCLAFYGSHTISYLPSTTTILTISSIYHLAEIAYLWYLAYQSDATTHEDKKQIHHLAMKYIEKPLSEKIQSNPITLKLGINISQKTVDKIANQLIDETLDHYWKTLSETFILGMPLVS